MNMQIHEFYMQRCLQLAKIGRGYVAPNPMVGALLVSDNKVIGEGYHQKFGAAHAEVNAINEVKDEWLLKNATLYVSLEPCVHYGKTPPCSELIIESGIRKVVVACTDPHQKVAGKGIRQLKDAGVEVINGVLEKEAIQLNKYFFYYHTQNKPYIILKWAQTADGYMGRERGSNLSKKVSNWYNDILVHQLRAESSAILIGYHTALEDNPSLNNRLWVGNSPLRVVIDLAGSLPPTLKLFNDGGKTIVFTHNHAVKRDQINYVYIDESKELVSEILNHLYTMQVQSLLVEGGAKTLNLFINSQHWNEAHLIISQQSWGNGIQAPTIKGELVGDNYYLNEQYKIYKPKLNL
ncbi:MAG: bifunctional diaminohydroxyphosphoribosylaminopyrimidine deaminase/5-amino-6-(5-phosphoribosylamino)uracil reductase RibD [Bacteroidia bacterium]|nr:bifunctional diaminohydroxyphosphoribosylaminopyrimidine deaminase/5-amino-6-(5-phosphoribosylamino)uracil reductase RibD [Bacteroidia bacterium]MCZ2248742.1 bifunctional diaminohydroxyphosphoribosylaminopyrimidine deaminase/5-amino-6-(5-phosphoribosylamino)uracil reductase RibD [Bacteroidia bacterium]